MRRLVSSLTSWPDAKSEATRAQIVDSYAAMASRSPGRNGRLSRADPPPGSGRGGNRSASCRPMAPTTASMLQPAKQCRSILPSSVSRSASEGPLSACAGHRAVHDAGPDRRTRSRCGRMRSEIIKKPAAELASSGPRAGCPARRRESVGRSYIVLGAAGLLWRSVLAPPDAVDACRLEVQLRRPRRRQCPPLTQNARRERLAADAAAACAVGRCWLRHLRGFRNHHGRSVLS